jgi:hypothetical protein
MTHWQKGNKDLARQWYDKAITWMAQSKSNDEELIHFRDESAALLNRPEMEMPNGADVFERNQSG